MRLRRWSPAVTLMTLLTLLITSCTGTSAPESGSGPRETPRHAEGTDASSAAPAVPQPGTCRLGAEEKLTSPDYWFDDSLEVPCTEPHNLETAGTVLLTEATVAEVKKHRDDCWTSVHNYLGVSEASWVPWGYAAWLPSEEQVADGAVWMRCDVVFPMKWNDFSELRTTTGSANGAAAIDTPDELWACLEQHPRVTGQELIPCNRPHRYEQTGTLAIIRASQHYPTPARLRTESRQCLAAVSARDRARGVTTVVSWDSRSAFEPGGEVSGVCFRFFRDGRPLPSRD